MDYEKEMTNCQRELETLSIKLNTAVLCKDYGTIKQIIEKQRKVLLRWICCVNILMSNGVYASVYDLYKTTVDNTVKYVLEGVSVEKALDKIL